MMDRGAGDGATPRGNAAGRGPFAVGADRVHDHAGTVLVTSAPYGSRGATAGVPSRGRPATRDHQHTLEAIRTTVTDSPIRRG